MKAVLLGILGLSLCVIITLSILGVILLVPLKIKYWKELRRKGLEELKKEVFRFEESYFSYIGDGHESVREFKNLVETQDVNRIKKDWKKLSSDFRILERQAGHRGRPLIMDYYDWYEMGINELIRRIGK